jgi:chemosensory pili system protein ChpA (sensor histidine kinase/response regulator)
MNSPTSSSLDLGPLSWVKTEIEHSLTEARANLDKLAADTGDTKALKYVSTHLHQVTGALSMVGLGAATRFTEEIETLVATLDSTAAKADVSQRIAIAKAATGTLSTYLDGLMAGEPDRPMSLAISYVALNRGRGATDASESDLFSPDLSVAVPIPDDTIALPKSEMLLEAIKQRRGLYQAGLLKLLREKDLVGGARDMRNATLAIEALQLSSPTRAFWFTASGFFDAVASSPADAGTLAVQLFGKIDQQIKLLVDGVQKTPEKLFRDLLLVIGKSRASTERVRAIRALYRLDELLAAAPERDTTSDESTRTLVRSLRDQVQLIKDNWMKFTSGNRAALEAFAQQGETLAKHAQPLPNVSMAELLRVIGLVGPHLKKVGALANEVQALEIASALLFVESSLENYNRLSPEFAKQSLGIIGRIKGAMSGSPLPALDASTNAMMDDFTRRAQERLLVFQVGQEVQVNLATIESTLDGFFRDPLKISELSILPPLFSQVQGALAILELDEAAALNQMLRERVVQFSSGALKGVGEDAETVAEGISALGLFISALQQNAADARASLLPALVRFGLAEKPAEPEKSLLKSPLSEASPPVAAPITEADIDVDKQKVQALYADWKQQPEATTTRDQLRDAVKELKQNAEISGDTASAKSSEATLKAIDATFDPLKTGVSEALANIAPSKPADAPAAQIVQLIDAPADEVDQELLDIFLEEATEVVATIRENLLTLTTSPHDKECLTTIRRGYHTLKGSGRMVGLNDLGEVAWRCEQVLNKWLKDDKPVSVSLTEFITVTSDSFAEWVLALQTKGTVNIDGTRINALAEALKADREPVLASVVEDSAPFVAEADVAVDVASNVDPLVRNGINEIVDVIDRVDATRIAATSSLELMSTIDVTAVNAVDVADMVDVADVADAANVIAPASDIGIETSEIGAPLSDAGHEPVAEPIAQPVIETATEAANQSNEIFAELPSLPTAPEAESDDEIAIGHVRLPLALYEIYLGESSQHVEVLDGEMAAIEANLFTPVSHEFMRAAHTLTSSSRTTGFESIADVAFALEKWLTDAIELVPEFNTARVAETRAAIDALANMVLSLHMQEYPEARVDVVDSLVALRAALKSGAQAGEGTFIKMPVLSAADDSVAATLVSVELNNVEIVAAEESALVVSAASTTDTEIDASLLWDTPATPVIAADEAPPSVEESTAAPDIFDFAFASDASEGKDAVSSVVPDAIDEVTVDEPSTPESVEDQADENIVIDAANTAIEIEVEVSPALIDEPVTSVSNAPAQADAVLPEAPPPFEPSDVFAIASAGALIAATTAFVTATPPVTASSSLDVPSAAPTATAADTLSETPPAAISAVADEDIFAPVVSSAVEPTIALAAAAMTPLVPPLTAPQANLSVDDTFESGRDRRAVKDDVDTDLLPIFLEEAKEISPQVGDALRRWKASPLSHEPVGELARHLHTLKGSARMAGLMRLGELAHVMETRIINMDKIEAPQVGDFAEIDDRLDRFNIAIESLSAGDLSPIIEIPIESVIAADALSPLPAPMAAIAAARAEIVAEGEKLEGRERIALLRVNADLIDRFVNEAGELAIARSRVDLELQAFKKALLELNDNVARMKVQLREIEIGAESQIQSRLKEAETQGEQFDPLEFDRFSRMQELTRFMAESLNDVVTLQQSLAKNIDEADSAILQQGRLNRDLQQGLMSVRLVPLGNLQDRFHRLVRQTAKELDKKANLEFRGVRVEIDRSVLEKITAPFEHLLRNAVAHGLETPASRAVSGKSEIGEISIDARQIGNEVILTLADDGAGLNFKRIREKAIEKGMLAADAEINEAQLTQFIFAAGFSTADNISQLSGRGVGMDVVRNEIVSLGGRIDITSSPGRGTTFTIALPLTLAVTQAVMVTVGEITYAIPSVMIEQVQEFKGKRYEPLLALNEIEWKGNKYPLRSMEVILGGKAKVSAQRHAFVILAKSGQQRAAVQVDDILGNREIVVKSIGPQLARIPGIAGATVLGSGQVVLIMNPVQLVFREATTITIEQQTTVARTGAPLWVANEAANEASNKAGDQSSTMTMDADTEQVVPSGMSLADAIAATEVAEAGFVIDHPIRANPLVMVVDDSLTVRKITSRMLIRENFEVATAKDGVDGLQQLHDIEPDIILLDIEMPRMDGFEFARNVRADPKTRHIPIIMITSRTADKHRNHAMELGVNEYMGKPYQEEQLLVMIRQYTRQQAAA